MRNSIVFSLTLLAASMAQAQTLNLFGASSVGYTVSADGRTVAVGQPGVGDSLWSSATGLRGIGGVAPGTGAGAAQVAGRVAISADGSRVAGSILSDAGVYVSAYYASSDGGVTGSWTAMPTLGGAAGLVSTTTWGISASGRYIAGSAYTPSGQSHGTIGDITTGSLLDVTPAGQTQARVQAISNDGSVAIGQVGSSQNGSIWRRQADGSYAQTTVVVPGVSGNAPLTSALSQNGVWAAGASQATTLPYIVNTSTGAVTTFPRMAYTDGRGKSVETPAAISEDGQTIIGTQGILGTLDTNKGFIWTASGGTVDLDSYFAGYGIDTANAFNFVSPIGMSISAAGMTITGIALDNTSGSQLGFVVTIPSAVPEPSSYAMLAAGMGVLGLVVRRRRTLK